jgi:Flp pilus assembly pilin Flp
VNATIGRPAMGERGQALVEYGAVIALVAAGLIGGLALLGRATGNAYTRTAAKISQEGGGQYGLSGVPGVSGPIPTTPVAARPAEPPDSTADSPADSSGQHVAAR